MFAHVQANKSRAPAFRIVANILATVIGTCDASRSRIMQINKPNVGQTNCPETGTRSHPSPNLDPSHNRSNHSGPGLATCKIKINALIEIKFIITIARATLLWCSLIKVSAVCHCSCLFFLAFLPLPPSRGTRNLKRA